jgi:replicative DNA helicase
MIGGETGNVDIRANTPAARMAAVQARMGNGDTEREVLHLALMHPESQPRIFDEVKNHYFYEGDHEALFSLMSHIYLNQWDLNPSSLQHFIQTTVKPGKIEDLEVTLARVMQVSALDTLDNILQVLQELYRSRLIHGKVFIEASQQFLQNKPIEQVIDTISNALINVDTGKKTLSTKDVARRTLEEILNPQAAPPSLKTDLIGWDEQFGGIVKDRLYAIGALGRTGKTALLTFLIKQLCKTYPDKIAVQFFSFEMSEARVIRRIVSSETFLTENQLTHRAMPLKQHEQNKVIDAMLEIEQYPLEIVYQTLDISQMKLKVKNFALRNKGKHLIIMTDHIGKIGYKSDDQRVKIIEACEMHKSFCRDYEASVIMLSQLKKELEDSNKYGSTWHRPNVSHLMESGSIFTESDMVGLLWRPEIYAGNIHYDGNPNWDTAGKMILLNEKNRDGQAPNDIIFNCDIRFNHFEDYFPDFPDFTQ